ncbi:hypothetical protein LJC36_02045 [Desulfovibrio sp. OttesenSCG-928-C14]|nr:hypothetical protein [Desulfovibrio sp. OttesenSCG-928-C14]
MPKLDFAKFSPGGNPTLLITGGKVPEDKRLATALALMDPLHLGAEQVGYTDLAAAPPRLEMMAGEFCLNASRCLAFAMFRQNLFLPLDGTDDLFGLLRCSGAAQPLQARIKNGRLAAKSALELECFISLELRPEGSGGGLGGGLGGSSGGGQNSGPGSTQVAELDRQVVDKGAVLVRLPGISHLLLSRDLHPLPEDRALDEVKAWADKLDLHKEEAYGVVWYEACRPKRLEDAAENVLFQSITPYVCAGGNIVAESACGSASLALALLMAPAGPRAEGKLFLNVLQPSGESLRLRLQDAPGGGYDVEAGGMVRLVARGETFLP